MPSLWNERAMLIDAEKVTLLAPAAPLAHGRSRPHGGDPAGAAAELLADSRRRRGAWRNRLRVWIGYPWAHAQVLPWQVTLGGGDHQWEAYARALMRERGVAGPLRLRLDGPPRPSAAGVRHRCRPARRAGTHGLGRRLAALVLPRSAVFLPGAASRRARQRRPGAGRDRCAELPVAVRTGLGRSDHAAPRPGAVVGDLVVRGRTAVRPRGRERLSLVVPVRAGCAALPDASRWLGAPHPMLAVAA